MKSYAEQREIEVQIIEAHLQDPDLTLRELSEMVGFESKWPAQRILAGFYAGQIERETKDEKYRALETAMALAAAEEARRLAKLPFRYQGVLTVESRATRKTKEAA